MRLIYEPHYTFDLDIVGYQFPDNTEGGWDSNWLMIKGSITQPTLEFAPWTFIEPCLTTYEVGSLAAWLRELALGEPRRNKHWPTRREFVEPNLSFQVRDAVFLTVTLAYESAPPWASRGVGLSYPQERTMLELAASDLENQLKRFPPRIS